MPELPEVETTRRGLAPLVTGKVVCSVIVRVAKLRQPIPASLPGILSGQRILDIGRRAKYLLFHCQEGTLLLHLGMTGHLRVVPGATPPERHDHLDLALDDGALVRFNDSRRFGTLLWVEDDPLQHPLLARLGPEPLEGLSGDHFVQRARGRKIGVKPFIMDQSVVVGVGNIYASEALFRARIHPQTPAGHLSPQQWQTLAAAIRAVLIDAVAAGDASLRDPGRADHHLGYFRIQPLVYGRGGEPCPNCGRPLAVKRIAQRSTYFCPRCQQRRT